MTNEQINRLVAEELGWKPYCHPADYLWSLVDRNDNLVGRHKRGGLDHDHCWAVCNLNFCEDYNAAAEMREAIRRDDEQVRFAQCLCDLTFAGHEDIMPEYYWTLLNSTPRQQAEAFLRLRGKWREE